MMATGSNPSSLRVSAVCPARGLKILGFRWGRAADVKLGYDSTNLVPFGDKLAAAPMSSLWG